MDKFCEKCGNPLDENGKCPKCSKAKTVKKIVIFSVIGLVLVLAGVIATLIILNNRPIDLNKYVSVSFKGYDGYGTATVKFDKAQFRDDYEEKLMKRLKKASSEVEGYEDYMDLFDEIEATDLFLEFCASYDLDKDTDLKNGEKITLSWNCDEEATKKAFGVELKYSDTEYEVSGLKEVKSFDPFEDVALEYDGYSTIANAWIVCKNANNAYFEELSYSLNKSSDLKNGDSVEVSVTRYGDDPTEYCIKNFGKKPTALKKTITVSGLEEIPTFDPFADVTIEYDGFNTMADAKVVCNSGNNPYFDEFVYELNKDRDLKNGDTIEVSVTTWYGDDPTDYCIRYFSKKPSALKKTFTVSGLQDVPTFDPFVGVELEISGISPNLSVGIICTDESNEMYDNLYYELDKSSDLKNGDTVEVSIEAWYDVVEYCINNYGMMPITTKKTFTISGMKEYYNQLGDIPATAIDELVAEGEGLYADQLPDWAPSEQLVSFDYVGSILLTRKPDAYSWRNDHENELYFVYKVTVRDTYESFDQVTEMYWYTMYSDLIQDTDGNISYENSYYWLCEKDLTVDSHISTGWFSTMRWYYKGYETYDAFYDAVVTGQESLFECETDIVM